MTITGGTRRIKVFEPCWPPAFLKQISLLLSSYA
jgi:hypothetical protein